MASRAAVYDRKQYYQIYVVQLLKPGMEFLADMRRFLPSLYFVRLLAIEYVK